jgi:1D-myo-inositol 3-kinase
MSAAEHVPDLVVVGHVTVDRIAGAERPGGAGYYVAMAATRLGLRVGLVTSFAADFAVGQLPAGVEVVTAPSALTTTFEVTQGPAGRALRLVSRAADLEEAHLPPAWRRAPLALLCPVANEVDPALAAAFPEGALALVPQGWMRKRGPEGIIEPEPWDEPEALLVHAQWLVMSEEDTAPFPEAAREWVDRVPLAAVTRGRHGATLFVNGEPYHVQPDVATEVDETGAGDVFATTALIEYQRRADPWEAAAAAACAGAASVEAPGAEGILDRPALERRLAEYRRRRGG